MTVVGFGTLGQALATGLCRSGFHPERLRLLVRDHRAAAQTAPPGAHVFTDPGAAIEDAGLVVLCIKPQECAAVCRELPPLLTHADTPVLSLCAGLRVNTLRAWLNGHGPVLRAMPNLAVANGEGATALYADDAVDPEFRDQAEALMASLGLALWVEHEAHLDTVTALSGSGPAYFILLLKSLIEAGVRQGLDEATSRRLAVQTLTGTAGMTVTDASPAELIDQVACRGGSTRKALDALTAAGFGTAITEAVGAAADRCRELDQRLSRNGDKDAAVLSA